MDFQNNLDNLYDIARADTLERMKIDEDILFSQKRRKPGRPGCLAGVDETLAEKEERARQRKLKEGKNDMSKCVSGVDLHLLQHKILYKRKNITINLPALIKTLRNPCHPPLKR